MTDTHLTLSARALAVRWPALPHLTPAEAAGFGDAVVEACAQLTTAPLPVPGGQAPGDGRVSAATVPRSAGQ